MALRFRRGSENDRINPSFVPEDGEPVWIVDEKRLYIGDGSTSGGVLVTGSSGSGSTPGIVDNTTGVVLTLDNAVATFTSDVELDSSDLILAGGAITGTGNINILGNITGSGTLTSNIANVGSINVTAGLVAGAVIQAPFFDGDLTGNVFADDSTIIINRLDGSITTPEIFSPTTSLSINTTPDVNNSINVITSNNSIDTELSSVLNFTSTSTDDLSTSSIFYGRIFFNRDDLNGLTTPSFILGGRDGIFFATEPDGNIQESNYLALTSSGVAIGRFFPSAKLDVNGDAIISGSLTAGAMLLSGSIIDTSDSSEITVTPAVTFNSDVVIENSLTVANTLTVDTLEVTNFQTAGSGTPELASDTDILLTAGTRVEITQSPLKMASFTTTERTALTPQNGDIIYNTTDSKFQGYAGGAWVDLH
jgi:hypothetical protein